MTTSVMGCAASYCQSGSILPVQKILLQ